MEVNPILNISPIDGRYYAQVDNLKNYFSEFALIKHRVEIEIEYFISLSDFGLSQLQRKNDEMIKKLRDVYKEFSIDDALKIKETEKITNHDVKAVEYFVKEKVSKLGFTNELEFIHFGLTSQDINNTATPLLLKRSWEIEILPKYLGIIERLRTFSQEWKNIPMLARTHGQPASPTLLGKEIAVFVERLEKQLSNTKVIFSAKFGGATGNFNAHHVAYPEKDWKNFANVFVLKVLGLDDRNQFSTQIEHYDNLSSFFDLMKRLNTILIDLNRDIWTYISMDYFKQKLKAGEIGSSAMPHKVNPIDFENSEGNLGVANAMFEHLSSKLPISRLQRDLTDSTVLRNIGVPIAHTYIACNSLIKGLDKLLLNEIALNNDLEKNWAVVAEAIQTILRREGYPKPYEALKDLTRTNNFIDKESISKFIDSLQIEDRLKKELKAITPQNYTGI
ncbi:MAG: adenylosuccinate lyase [Bacteroidota bacterium]|jgi:adenylosuccinate lyase